MFVATTSPGLAAFPAFLLRPVPIPLPILEPDAWRVISSRPGFERRLVEALTAISLDAWSPRYRSRWVSRGRRYERLNVFLPTYVFVRFDPANPIWWHRVMSLDGVRRLLPGIVTDEELDAIRETVADLSTETEPVYDVKRRFLPLGSAVRFGRGPFTGYDGTVVSCDGISAWVKIFGLLGRENDINVPADWCEVLEQSATSGHTETPRWRKRARRGRFRPNQKLSV